MKFANCTLNLSLLYLSFKIVPADCSCSDHVDIYGYGKCQKVEEGLGLGCYVHQPSTCGDLRNIRGEGGKQFSFEACNRGKGKKCTGICIKLRLY